MKAEELATILNEVLVNDGEQPITVNNDEPLKDQGIDSLTMTSFFFEIEDKTSVSIPDEEIDKLKTINHIVEYFEKK